MPRALAEIALSFLGRKYYLFGLRVWCGAAFTRYDFCHAVDVMSLFAARGFAARGIPVLLDVNEIPDPFERQGRHFVGADPAVKRHLARAIARDLPHAKALIAASDAMADFVAQHFRRNALPIRNIRAPLDNTALPDIRRDLVASDDARIMAYPCTAAPFLGVETAIEMLRHLPETWLLVFVGRFVTVAYREQIERLVRFHRLDRRVKFKGELPNETYLRYLAGADFGLIPLSFVYRNQRLVLPWRVVDLAAAGVPLIATPSDELRRLGHAFDLGEIADGTDSISLAAAALRLAAASPQRIAAIRRDLRSLCDQFSPERRRAAYRDLLATLAERKTGRAAFVFNVALRDNRRLIDFIDQACELGWRVDLYSVRGPPLSLFHNPERVRLIDVPDRLVVVDSIARWAAGAWRALLGSPITPVLPRIGDWLAGTYFGLRQIARCRGYARLVSHATQPYGPWDLVIATDIFACAAGLRVKAACRVLDATEIPVLKQRSSRFLRRIPFWLGWVFRQWEWRFVSRARLVLTPSQAMAQFLRRRYRGKRVQTIRNAGALSRADAIAQHPDGLRALLGLPDDYTILVSPSGVSRETGALLAVRTLRFLPADHVLVFIGRISDPGFATELNHLIAAEHQEHRCFILGPLDYGRYLRYLADADIGLVLFDTAIGNLQLAAPNRFFDLLAMEVPAVVTPVRDVATLLGRAGSGIVVAERRPAAVAAAIVELAGRRRDRAARATLARLARFYRWDKERERLLAALTRRVGPLPGKRIALLTLRNALSNRRFRLIGAALHEAGAELHAFDTRIGAPASPGERPAWLTTVAVD